MKPRLKYVEVYITNVCSYSCSHCQSLNNFAFKGHQRWKDYQEEYTLLSKNIEFDTIQIMGGEVTLNPDFEQWVNGISSLWPTALLEISTNGSRLDKINDNIYQVLSRNNGTLWITCHDITLYDQMLKFSKEFLKEIVVDFNPDTDGYYNWEESYNSAKEDFWPECKNIEQFSELPDNIKKEFIKKSTQRKTVSRMLKDKNGVQVRLDWSQSFVSSAIGVVDEFSMKMKFNNDPIEAHDACYFKNCHQLNKGKLYKCPLVSVLPDFLNQFNVSMSDEDKFISSSYVPVSIKDSPDVISTFVDNIEKPIPQCKFCPVKLNKYNFVGTDKKIKIIPLS